MMKLHVMDEQQIRFLHTYQMHRDFPPSELKGLSAILNLCRRDEYDVLAAYEDGHMIAYALVYRPKKGRVYLLDYLAVEPELRNRGYGQQMLEALKAYYAGRADCLMVECERPKTAPDEQEARRRIRFYQYAQAEITNVRIWLFDVEYTILVLPCEGYDDAKGKNWAAEMLELYRQMLPEELFARNVRLIRS